MEDLDKKIIELMDLFDGEVTTADKIDRPQQALDREMYKDFMDRNPMAGGGMLAQPSADGSRQEYATSTVKTKKFKYPITNQFGTFYSDKAPPKVKSKYDNLTPEMKDFYKKTTGKTWNKKDWDSGNYQRQNLSRKGKQSKVVKESKMSPFYKKIGFFKQFENNVRVKGERIKLNKKGYITFEQLNNLLGRKDTESAIDDLKRVLVGDRPSPWLEKKEGVAKWKKSKNLVIQRGDSMGTNYIKYPDKKTLKSMKQYYKNQEFIDIAKRGELRKPSIEGMKVFYEDKDLMNAIRKWSGNPNDKEALKIINSVFGAEELAGPNAIKNLGRALIGEIKVEGIKQDKVLGKKILQGVTRTANGQAGRSAWDQAAYMYAKDRMNLLFERGIGDKNFQQFFDEIDGLLRETLGKDRARVHIDEIYSLRTGLTNNNQVYSVFSQLIDKNLNSKIKQNYDATFSKNLINVRKELAKNNPNFNEVKRITDLQNVKYKEYSSKYPNAKFATFGEFDIEKNRFKSPEEVFGIERFNELPSDIQKKIKQDYRKNRISIDVGGAQTQKELLSDVQTNLKKGSPLYKKLMKFCPKSNGGEAGVCTIDEAMDGLVSESKQLKSGNMNEAQAKRTAQKIRAVTRVGTGSTLTGLLGPYGLAGEVVIDGAIMANNMLDGGDTYKEALSKSLIKYAMPKDARERLEKETDLNTMILGTDTSGLAANYADALKKDEDLQQKYENYLRVNQEDMSSLQDPYSSGTTPMFSTGDKNKALRELTEALERSDPTYGKNIYDVMKFGSPEQQAFATKQEVFDAQKMQNRMDYDRKILGPLKDLFGTGFYSPEQLKQLELKADRDTELIGQMSEEDKMQRIANYGGVANLAGGGIAKLAGVDQGPPPESGPNSQGLQGLLKRGMKI